MPSFQYESKDEVKLDKLIHSILVESSKTKPLIPNCFTKKICESSGLESNDTAFHNLLGSIAEYTLNSTVKDIKNIMKVNKSKKERQLTTSEVKKTLEQREAYLCANKVIPEMGISQTKDVVYNPPSEE